MSPDIGQVKKEKDNYMVNTFVSAFFQEEDGQDLVEYSLLLAFIALAAVAILTTTQASIKTLWTTVNTKLAAAQTAAK